MNSHKPGVQTYSSIQKRFQAFAGKYGYEAVETNIVEAADLFLTRAGDQIITRLFTFEHKNRMLALRPEFTAAAALKYVSEIEKAGSKPPVVRWQFGGVVFEDKPENGSSLEQHSLGAELLGWGSTAADAEIIALSVKSLIELGIDNVNVVIGNVALLRSALSRYGLDQRTGRFLLNQMHELMPHGRGAKYVLEKVERLFANHGSDDRAYAAPQDTTVSSASDPDTHQMLDLLLDAAQRGAAMGGRTRHDIARRLIQKRQRALERPQIQQAVEFLARLASVEAQPAEALSEIRSLIPDADQATRELIDNMNHLFSYLNFHQVNPATVTLRPALARNWDYYTGMVFEIRAGSAHLGGGGRYDELARLLGSSSDVPAVGFALFPDMFIHLMPADHKRAHTSINLAFEHEALQPALSWASLLREQDLAVTVSEFNNRGEQFVVDQAGSLHYSGNRYMPEDVRSLLIAMGLP